MPISDFVKNIGVEGKVIKSLSDVKDLNKFMTTEKINVLMINRVIGVELFTPGVIPLEYYDELKKLEQEERDNLIQENNARISRTIFNKNNKVAFWRLLEEITTVRLKFY